MRKGTKNLLPDVSSYLKELQVGIDAVVASGRVILSQLENKTAKRYGLEFKAEVDKLADKTGASIVSNAYPKDTLLTEERKMPREFKNRIWLGDFLDGTTNFLNGSRNYSVLLSLVENDRLVLGLSYLPATDELFCAVRGGGAFLNGQKISVSGVDDLSKAVVCLDAGYLPDGAKKITGLFKSLRPHVGAITMFNANGYTLSMLSKGEIAGLVHLSFKIWEASVLLIAQEAGAEITDHSGKPLDLRFDSNKGFGVVVSNKLIHKKLLEHI